MVKAQKFIYARRFEGEPKPSDFDLQEEELPPVKDGEILVEAVFLSVDPYMRPYMERYPVGSIMIGGQVAKVIESKNDKYPVGALIFGQLGWRSHSVFHPDKKTEFEVFSYVLPPLDDKVPASLALGVLGMPGNTAYFGLLELCQPKAGETVVVSGAAGAVGSLVGQIAKAKGCRVVGLAGDDGKCAWLKTLGFDQTINYKSCGDLEAALKAAAPDGYDCYFDNVGGPISAAILQQMRLFGRIAVCGAISSYNDDPSKLAMVPTMQPAFMFKQLKMEGFLVTRWKARWLEGISAMGELVKTGKVKFQETRTKGFVNMPKAFIGMLRGENTGKALVEV